jgi:Na+/H+ antiporter NhaD/arsenite permease-like protein
VAGAAASLIATAPHALIQLAAVAIFAATYCAVAVGRIPGFRVERAGAAFIGAALMAGVGVMPLADAYRAIDFDTITLLLGMMIVIANLQLAGIFPYLSNWIVSRAHRPLTLLAALVALTGVLSAFLVNDAVCLVITPLIVSPLIENRRNPIPYLLAIAMASNIGSVATMTGNPQNMIIGGLSNISYVKFTVTLTPVALIGLLLTALLIALAYPAEFWTRETLVASSGSTPIKTPDMFKPVLITIALVTAFFAGVTPARAAVTAGAVMLLSRRVRSESIYQEVDWALLLMFCSLFIVVAGLERNVLTASMAASLGRSHLESVPVLSVVTAVLSNLVSNVPAVLVLRPFVTRIPDQQRAWLTIAMASTLAGNFTILGSVANLIVVQRARMQRIDVGFWDYFKVGAPLTIVTLALGILWLR